MKKLISVFLTLLLLAGLFAGCSGNSGSISAAPQSGPAGEQLPAGAPEQNAPSESAEERPPAAPAESGTSDDPAPDDRRIEGPGFDSGEEALLAALDAIRRCDVNALLACYAVESFTENYRFDRYYALSDYNPTDLTAVYLPEGTAFADEFNYLQRRNQVCRNAALPFMAAANDCFARGLIPDIPNDFTFFFRLRGQNQKESLQISGQDYLRSLQAGTPQQVLSGLQATGDLFELATPPSDVDAPDFWERRTENLRRRAEACGADEVGEYGVSVSVDGCDCFFTVTAACFGGSWYLLKLGSSYADITSSYTAGCFSVQLLGHTLVPGGEAPSVQAPETVDSGRFRVQGAGFDTSAAAALAYTEALRSLDFSAAATASFSDTQADENLPIYTTSGWELDNSPLLGGSSFGEPLGRACQAEKSAVTLLQNYLTTAARLQGENGNYASALPGLHQFGYVRTSVDADTRGALQSYLSDPAIARTLEGMTVSGVDRVMDETTDDRMAKYLEWYRIEHYAADVVTVQMNGKPWYIWVESVCRDGRWYHINSAFFSWADLAGYPREHLLHS